MNRFKQLICYLANKNIIGRMKKRNITEIKYIIKKKTHAQKNKIS